MSEKPPPSRLQFHLATAILIMMVIAVSIGLNLRPRQVGDGIDYGWPCTAMSMHPMEPIQRIILAFQAMAEKTYPSLGPESRSAPEHGRTRSMYSLYYLPGIFVNLFTITAACIALAIFSERCIRRPERGRLPADTER